ncbi:hypothetical protein B0T20DRAFT_215651 [Sordaria brevicollis]|uniref:Uncharacterized protein n=1 Tax=Sordaria brevicollis TaxID=83679 RepID=A0AAE0UC54_SORBR|nr:hypothetical protein B0T20DRAFT_215651 [Sordaria brevicollis]
MDHRSPNKRKRALSTTSTSNYSTTSSTIINPLSHPPSTLKQFIPSGNSPDAPLPSTIYPDFPHKPLPSSPTSSRPRSRSRSRRDSFASSHHSHSDLDDATSTAGTTHDSDFDGQTDAATDAETLSVTSHGKPYAKRDPVRSASRIYKLHQSRVGALVAVIQRCLAEGDISLARRAFGILIRADVNGKRIDLRFGGYWEVGAEILMRAGEDRDRDRDQYDSLYGEDGTQKGTQMDLGDGDGEGQDGEDGEDAKDKREKQRLLRAARNKDQVRAYYEALIHLHPWSRMHPNKMGALDFYPALFGFEMEVCFAEHHYLTQALDRRPLDEPEEPLDDDLPMEDRFGRDDMEVDGYGQQSMDQLRSSPPLPDYSRRREDNIHPIYRLRQQKDQLRLKALEQMRDVARRMDAVMENSPYNKDVEMLRLRAMVALYVGDLCVPVSAQEPSPEGEAEGKEAEERINEEEGRSAQKAEREKARGLLEKMKELKGGELEEEDRMVLEMISGEGEEDQNEEEEEEGRGRGTFSLPLR